MARAIGSAAGPESRRTPIPPAAGGVAGATMVNEACDSNAASAAGPELTSALFAGWFTSSGALDCAAVFLDVLLNRIVIQLKVSQNARIDVLERRRFFIPSQPKAHFEHCRTEEPVFERFRLGHWRLTA